jgi:hypothetical protein
MSDKVKHTPGPWQAHGPVVTADGCRISQTHFGDNADADARLIAAAPCLLTVLERLVAVADDCDPEPRWAVIAEAGAAIAKAKGETP